jgi:hypothetical protein
MRKHSPTRCYFRETLSLPSRNPDETTTVTNMHEHFDSLHTTRKEESSEYDRRRSKRRSHLLNLMNRGLSGPSCPCSTYPVHDSAWLANCEQEAFEAVRALRHHACLALWCGNNELEQAMWVTRGRLRRCPGTSTSICLTSC